LDTELVPVVERWLARKSRIPFDRDQHEADADIDQKVDPRCRKFQLGRFEAHSNSQARSNFERDTVLSNQPKGAQEASVVVVERRPDGSQARTLSIWLLAYPQTDHFPKLVRPTLYQLPLVLFVSAPLDRFDDGVDDHHVTDPTVL
jgi:hypothetical protein